MNDSIACGSICFQLLNSNTHIKHLWPGKQTTIWHTVKKNQRMILNFLYNFFKFNSSDNINENSIDRIYWFSFNTFMIKDIFVQQNLFESVLLIFTMPDRTIGINNRKKIQLKNKYSSCGFGIFLCCCCCCWKVVKMDKQWEFSMKRTV